MTSDEISKQFLALTSFTGGSGFTGCWLAASVYSWEFTDWCCDAVNTIEGCSEDGKIVARCALTIGKSLEWRRRRRQVEGCDGCGWDGDEA